MNAAAIAAALGERAEAVCRQHLPHGRRQGRYWIAGDLDGARGRSLYVRLAGPGPARGRESMARIVNLKHEPDAVARGAVRIDRRTRWGNPYRITQTEAGG